MSNATPRLLPRVCLAVEALEPRQLPASSWSALDFSNLQVNADRAGDARILVRFRPGQETPTADSLPRGTQLGAAVPLVPGLREVYLAPGASLDRTLAALQADPRVLRAEPNYRIHAERIPNDALFDSQWALNNTGQGGGRSDADLDLPEGWEATVGTRSTIIAVIDTGIDVRHPELAENIWRNPGEIPGNGRDDDGNGYVDDVNGYDFVNRDGDPSDDNGHGTHVAGIIGAMGGNRIGITGVSWRTRLMALKFLDANGEGSVADAIEALNYAVAMGARISNNSWGGGGPSDLLRDAIRNARDKGHIFVASAGNDGLDTDEEPSYPSSIDLDNVVAVAATDSNDRLAGFSNYGVKTVHLGAPGVGIVSTLPGKTYGTLSGTSMAAPHVSGVLSLVWDRNPTWNYQRVIDQVLRTVDPLPALAGRTVTGGRLNARAALLLSVSDRVGPRITDLRPFTDSSGKVDRVQITFSEPIAAETFTLADLISFQGPGGVNLMKQVLSVTGSGSRFFITFRPQAAPGTYRLRIGPSIYDLGLHGNAMDQDRDGRSGEASDDAFAGTFTIAAPASSSAASASVRPVKAVIRGRATEEDVTQSRRDAEKKRRENQGGNQEEHSSLPTLILSSPLLCVSAPLRDILLPSL